MRKKTNKLYSIKQIFLNFVKKQNKNIYLKLLLEDYFKEKFGNKIEYKMYSRKILYLKVSNKSLITYYSLKKQEMIEEVNRLAGNKMLKDIKYIL